MGPHKKSRISHPGPPGTAADTRVVTIGHDGSLGDGVSRESAHRPPGTLHLAVSLQLVNHDGEWLLQRRGSSKAAFADCWANTCCTHPRVGEDPAQAAARRVGEEMGLVVENLVPAGVFVYRATDPASGLVEHEMDHVFVAITDTTGATADPEEASETALLSYPEAVRLVASDRGAPWAAEVLRRSFGALDRR